MRIYGQQGQNQQQSARERRGEALQRFRRGHKSGDMVEGTFLHLEIAAPGTAWVNLEGAVLLASLPEDLADIARKISAGKGAGAMPTGVTEADFPIKNGQLCYFILENLEPEPLLRMLNIIKTPGQSNPQIDAALLAERQQALWQSILRLPLTQLAARYMQKRSALENILQQQLWQASDLSLPFPKTLPEMLTDFSAMTFADDCLQEENSPQAKYSAFIKMPGASLEAFNELELYRVALLENLQPYGLLGFFFVPWLCPAARHPELAFYRRHNTESSGPDRASAMQGTSYKLQAELERDGLLSRPELTGLLGSSRNLLRQLKPDEPDLLRFILSFRPEETRPSFSRKA